MMCKVIDAALIPKLLGSRLGISPTSARRNVQLVLQTDQLEPPAIFQASILAKPSAERNSWQCTATKYDWKDEKLW